MGPALDRLARDLPGQLRLIEAATSDDPQREWLGVEGLARSRPTAGIGWIVHAICADALFSERAATRRAAAWCLLQQGAPDLAQAVFEDALDDPDPLTLLLCLRGVRSVDPHRDWVALAPLLEASEIATRFEAYQLCGVRGLTAAVPALRDAIEVEEGHVQRAALTALARIDPAEACERMVGVPGGHWALIDAPIPLPASAHDTVDACLHARAASPLDPGRSRAWPRTHRRLLAAIAPPAVEACARHRLVEHGLTPAQQQRVDEALAFCQARRGADRPRSSVQSTVGQLLDHTADNRYRPPTHAHLAPDIAPSIKSLATWLGIVYSPRA